MKTKSLLFLLVTVAVAFAAVSCAPAPTPTPVPTAVPTKAPPTSVPPTTVPPTALPTVAATTAATAAPTTAATAAATSPTKAAAGGEATLPSTKATPTLIATTPKSMDQIQRLKPAELKALIDGGADIVVVDAQMAEVYVLGHVKGAVNLPWDMKIKSAGGLPKDKLAVLYCACAHEEDAGDVAMQLITSFGYKKIALLEGGWNKWVELGYPTEKGK